MEQGGNKSYQKVYDIVRDDPTNTDTFRTLCSDTITKAKHDLLNNKEGATYCEIPIGHITTLHCGNNNGNSSNAAALTPRPSVDVENNKYITTPDGKIIDVNSDVRRPPVPKILEVRNLSDKTIIIHAPAETNFTSIDPKQAMIDNINRLNKEKAKKNIGATIETKTVIPTEAASSTTTSNASNKTTSPTNASANGKMAQKESTDNGELAEPPNNNNNNSNSTHSLGIRTCSTRSSTPILSREIVALQKSVNESKVLSKFVTENAISKKDRSMRKQKDEGKRRESTLYFSDDQMSEGDNADDVQQKQHQHHNHHHHQLKRKQRKHGNLKLRDEQLQQQQVLYRRRSRSQCSIRSYDVQQKDKNSSGNAVGGPILKLKTFNLDPTLRRPNMRSNNTDFAQRQMDYLNRVLPQDNSTYNSDMDDDKSSPIMCADDDDVSSIIAYNAFNASFNEGDLHANNRVNDITEDNRSISTTTNTKTYAEHLEQQLKSAWKPPPKFGADPFCWKCHESGTQVVCSKCPRSYHLNCIKITKYDSRNNLETWICPECSLVESIVNGPKKNRSSSLSLEILNQLLSFVLKRMKNVKGHLKCFLPVDMIAKKSHYILKHVTFDTLQEKIDKKEFRCTEEFIIEAKWILHNALVLNARGSNNKETISAKTVLKCCRQEAMEIETCAECYLNANTRTDWFTQVCAQPHLIVWAKLKGFPYWPAKFMGPGQGSCVNVRFFGEHDRAFVPIKDCYLYSDEAPNMPAGKRTARELNDCIKEVNVHIDNIRSKIGNFRHAKIRTPFDPCQELQQLEFMMPGVTEFMKRQQGHLLKPSLQYKIVKVAGNTYIKKAGDIDRSEIAASSSNSSSSTSSGNKKKHAETDSNAILTTKYEVVSKSNTKEDDENSAKKVSVILKRKSPHKNESHDMETLAPKQNKIDNSNGQNINSNVNENTKRKRQNCEDEIHSDNNNVDDEAMPNKLRSKHAKIPMLTIKNNNLVGGEVDNRDNMMENLVKNKQGVTITKVNKTKNQITATNVEETKADEDGGNVLSLASNNVGDNRNAEVIRKVVKTLVPFVELKTEPISGDENGDNDGEDTTMAENNESTTIGEIATTTTTEAVQPTVEEQSQNLDKAAEIPIDGISSEPAVAVAPTLPSSLPETPMEATTTEQQLEQTTTTSAVQEKEVAPLVEELPLATIRIKQEILSDDENAGDDDAKCITRQDTEELDNDRSNNDEVRTIGETTIQRVSTKTHSPKTPKRQLGKKFKGIISPLLSSTMINKNSPNRSPFKRQLMDNKNVNLFKIQRAKKSFPNRVPGPLEPSTTITSSPNSCSATVSPTTVTSPMAVLSPITSSISNLSSTITTSITSTTITPSSSSSMLLATSSKKVLPTMVINHKNNAGNALKLATNMVSIPAHYVNSQCGGSDTNIPMSPLMAVYKSTLNNNSNNNNPHNNADGTTSASLVPNDTTSTESTPIPSITTISSSIATTTTATITTTSCSNSNNNSGEENEASENLPPVCLSQTTSSSDALPSSNTTNTISNSLDNNNTLNNNNNESSRGNASSPSEHLLHNVVTPAMAAAITDTLCRGPPRLAPRPNGPLSSDGSIMFPSQAGPVCQIISNNAHKLTDFFISIMENTLSEISVGNDIGNLQSKVTMLQMQIERERFSHAQELTELKRSSDVLLSEMRNSMELEKTRLSNEIRRQCALERQRSIEETKRKQWCANCGIEAQFYCCWNTSYCDYPCQVMHWNTHSTKCGQANRAQLQQLQQIQQQNLTPQQMYQQQIQTPQHQIIENSEPESLPQGRAIAIITTPPEAPSTSQRTRRMGANLRSNNNNNTPTSNSNNASNQHPNKSMAGTSATVPSSSAMLTSNYLRALPLIPNHNSVRPAVYNAQHSAFNATGPNVSIPSYAYLQPSSSWANNPAGSGSSTSARLNVTFPLQQPQNQANAAQLQQPTRIIGNPAHIRTTRARANNNNSNNNNNNQQPTSLQSGVLVRMPGATYNPNATTNK